MKVGKLETLWSRSHYSSRSSHSSRGTTSRSSRLSSKGSKRPMNGSPQLAKWSLRPSRQLSAGPSVPCCRPGQERPVAWQRYVHVACELPGGSGSLLSSLPGAVQSWPLQRLAVHRLGLRRGTPLVVSTRVPLHVSLPTLAKHSHHRSAAGHRFRHQRRCLRSEALSPSSGVVRL